MFTILFFLLCTSSITGMSVNAFMYLQQKSHRESLRLDPFQNPSAQSSSSSSSSSSRSSSCLFSQGPMQLSGAVPSLKQLTAKAMVEHLIKKSEEQEDDSLRIEKILFNLNKLLVNLDPGHDIYCFIITSILESKGLERPDKIKLLYLLALNLFSVNKLYSIEIINFIYHKPDISWKEPSPYLSIAMNSFYPKFVRQHTLENPHATLLKIMHSKDSIKLIKIFTIVLRSNFKSTKKIRLKKKLFENPHIDLTTVDKFGKTFLSQAIQGGEIYLFKIVLKHPLFQDRISEIIEACDISGNTPLMVACITGNENSC